MKTNNAPYWADQVVKRQKSIQKMEYEVEKEKRNLLRDLASYDSATWHWENCNYPGCVICEEKVK